MFRAMSTEERNTAIASADPSELTQLLNDLSVSEAVRVVRELPSHSEQDRTMSVLTGDTRERARIAISIVPPRVYCRASDGLNSIEVEIAPNDVKECLTRGYTMRRHGTGLDEKGNFLDGMFAFRPMLPPHYSGTLGAVFCLDEIEFWRRVDPTFARKAETTELDERENAAIEFYARPVRALKRKPVMPSSPMSELE